MESTSQRGTLGGFNPKYQDGQGRMEKRKRVSKILTGKPTGKRFLGRIMRRARNILD